MIVGVYVPIQEASPQSNFKPGNRRNIDNMRNNRRELVKEVFDSISAKNVFSKDENDDTQKQSNRNNLPRGIRGRIIQNMSDNVNCSLDTGDIFAENICSNQCRLKSGTGDVLANNISGAQCSFESGTGDILINGVKGKIEAKTGTGIIAVKIDELTDDMKVEGSDIFLLLPQEEFPLKYKIKNTTFQCVREALRDFSDALNLNQECYSEHFAVDKSSIKRREDELGAPTDLPGWNYHFKFDKALEYGMHYGIVTQAGKTLKMNYKPWPKIENVVIETKSGKIIEINGNFGIYESKESFIEDFYEYNLRKFGRNYSDRGSSYREYLIKSVQTIKEYLNLISPLETREGQDLVVQGISGLMESKDYTKQITGKIAGCQYPSRKSVDDYWAKRDKEEKLMKEAQENICNHPDNLYVVQESIEIDGMLLRYASEELRNNEQVVKAAILKDARAIQYTDEYNNEEMHRFILEKKPPGYPGALGFAPENVKSNKEIVLMYVKRLGYNIKNTSFELQQDKDVILAAINSEYPYLIEHITNKEVLEDKENMQNILLRISEHGHLVNFSGIESHVFATDEELQELFKTKFNLDKLEFEGDKLVYFSYTTREGNKYSFDSRSK